MLAGHNIRDVLPFGSLALTIVGNRDIVLELQLSSMKCSEGVLSQTSYALTGHSGCCVENEAYRIGPGGLRRGTQNIWRELRPGVHVLQLCV